MSLVFDIGQGAGLAGASGVRPFLPPLIAGALARGDTGVDFEGTSYSFLESPAFLLAVLVVAVAAYVIDRRGAGDDADQSDRLPPAELALAVIGLVLGALLFAGSLADGDHVSWWGLIAGAAAAALGYAAVALLLRRARRRLGAEEGTFIGVYGDIVALALAGLSILFPPLGFVALAAFVVLLVRARGSSGQKYQGLRILR